MVGEQVADRILIALIAGATPQWREHGFDTSAPNNAIHPMLARHARTEPHWVDLRDASRPWHRQRLAVGAAALAAPLLGMDDRKDELFDEVARLQRRTQVTAGSVVTVVLVVIGLIAAFGFSTSQEAAYQGRIASAGELTERARANIASTPDTALRYGIAAAALTGSAGERAALLKLLTTSPYDGALPLRAAPVTAATFSPDGRTVAVGSADGELLLSATSDPGTPTYVERGAGQAQSTLAFRSDGRMLFTGYADGTGRWWLIGEAQPPELVASRQVHPAAVQAARFGPEDLLATAADDGVALWGPPGAADVPELSRGFAAFDAVQSLAFAAPAPATPVGVPRRVVLHVAARLPRVLTLDVTDPGRPEPVDDYVPDIGPEGSVAVLSPDGRMFAAALDGTDSVGLWSARPVTAETPYGWFEPAARVAIEGEVTALGFAPNGRSLLVGTRTGLVITIDLTLPVEPITTNRIGADERAVTLLASSPDGRSLLTGARTAVRFWDTARVHPSRIALIPGPAEDPERQVPQTVDQPTAHAGVAAALNDDGSVVSGLFSGGYRERWTLTADSGPQAVGPGDSPVDRDQYAMDLDATGRLLVVGTDDGSVRVLDVSDDGVEEEVGSFAAGDGPISDLDLAPDGSTLLVIGRNGGASLWSIADRAAPRRSATLTAEGSSTEAPVRPGGALAAGGLAVLTSPTDGVSLWSVTDPAAPRRLANVMTGSAESVTLDPTGRSLLVKEVTSLAGDVDSTLWDLSTPERPIRIATVTTDSAPAAAYTPDGKVLATAKGRNDLSIWAFDEVGRPIELLTVSDHTSAVTTAAFSGDGRRIVTADLTGRFVVADLSGVVDVVADPVREACRSAGRGLDEREWAALIPTLPFRVTCA